MILTQQQVDGLRQRHDNAGHAHGYPAGMITDLLHTLSAMRAEQKKWKRLAQDRGERLAKIAGLVGKIEAKEVEDGG